MTPRARNPGDPAPRARAVWTPRFVGVLPFLLAIRLYQLILSPFVGGFCRHYPTCSNYAMEAFQVHGVLRGSLLTARRVLRCHPWGTRGIDPVPPATAPRGGRSPRGRGPG